MEFAVKKGEYCGLVFTLQYLCVIFGTGTAYETVT